ncbi:TonB family protein [Erythrobacter sp. W302b]|uniref:TonB family protein n=1 Tax=Erythrobacter sp. W302b TaxID=3389874 RepID=UPI00396B0E11
MSTEGGRAVVTARVAGRPRRLATEKQWRAAISGGDLKPDDLVEYEAPDCSPETRAAGYVPELQGLFEELLPAFSDWRKPADPVLEVLHQTYDHVPSDEVDYLKGYTAPIEVAASVPVGGRASRQAPKKSAPVASVKPVCPDPGGTGRQDQGKSPSPFLIGSGAIAVLLLAYVVFGGPGDESEPAEQVAASTAAPKPLTPVPTKTAVAPESDVATPSPTPVARAVAQSERQRLQREARSTPTPTPTYVPPPPAALVSQARAVQPRDQSRWANRIGEDYPARARQRGEEGTVGFRVTVGPNGRVEACDVTSSSGSTDLDKAACQGLRRYARFNPALNDAGEPVAVTWSSALTYRLD